MNKTILNLIFNKRESSIRAFTSLYYKEQFKYLKTRHSFHLVDPSPWPLIASLGAFMMTTGGVLRVCML